MLGKIKNKIRRLIGIKDPVVVDVFSQQYVLAQRMYEAELTHDQKVLATLPRVRVHRFDEEKHARVYFCGLEEVEILENLQPGDGMSLSDRVRTDNLRIPAGSRIGAYRLENVILHSNGKINIIETPTTKWERIED